MSIPQDSDNVKLQQLHQRAASYIDSGYTLLPNGLQTKKPMHGKWEVIACQSKDEIPTRFPELRNIGVWLEVSGLTDVDLDSPEAITAAQYILQKTMRFGHSSRPNSHYIYRLTRQGTTKFYDPMTRTLLCELRGKGQTIFPGSVHESGEPIEWGIGPTVPFNISEEDLVGLTQATAAAALLGRYWPDEGGRHNCALALGGWLAHSEYSEEDAKRLMRAVCEVAGDHEFPDRVQAVSGSYKRLAEGGDVSGYPRLMDEEYFDEKVLEKVGKWLGLRGQREGKASRITRNAVAQLEGTPTGSITVLPDTPDWNAEQCYQRYHNDFRYCPEKKSFYIWNGRYWELDIKEKLLEWTRCTINDLIREAATLEQSEQKYRLEWLCSCLNPRTRAEMRVILSTVYPDIKISIHEFDSDPMLLTVQNGTINLRTGELLPFNRGDYITKYIDVPYLPDAEAPLTLDMLRRALGDEKVLRELQKAIGTALTGETDKSVYFCYGPTDTGKTTFLTDIVYEMIGSEYAVQISQEAITLKNDHYRAVWAADMHARRCGLASELPKGFQMDAATIKAMTGRTIQKAKALYQMPFDSKPSVSIFIDTNNRPEFPGAEEDDALWNRVKLFFFRNRVKLQPSEEGYIPEFKNRVKAEFPGILAWAVQGCLLWQQEGMIETEAMTEQKTEYREEINKIQEFIADRITVCPGDMTVRVSVAEVRDAYKAWYDSVYGGKDMPSYTDLNTALEKAGGERSGKTEYYQPLKKSVKIWNYIKLNTLDRTNRYDMHQDDGNITISPDFLGVALQFASTGEGND